MPCYKFVPKKYVNESDTEILIHKYIFPKANLIGGFNVNPSTAAFEMHLLQNIWFQSLGVRHFILSLTEYESTQYSLSLLKMIAYQICVYFDEYQIVFAIHKGVNTHIHFVMNTAKDRRGYRYSCVNLSNYNTIEFRMFRGTLKYNTVIATLQLVERLCSVAIVLSDMEVERLSWSDFVKGIDKHRYPHLVQYLKERDLYINEAVNNDEEEI